jgi:predicted nucleic acid-binding protein
VPSKLNVIVADASVLAPAVADGGIYGSGLRRRLRGETVAVPDLARIEVISVIRRQLHASSLDLSQATQAIDDLLDLPLIIHPTAGLLDRAWALRDNFGAYDACYVALAELLDWPLLTADVRLSRSPGANCAIEVVTR